MNNKELEEIKKYFIAADENDYFELADDLYLYTQDALIDEQSFLSEYDELVNFNYSTADYWLITSEFDPYPINSPEELYNFFTMFDWSILKSLVKYNHKGIEL